MADVQADDRATWPKERWASASVEDLKAERAQALQRLQKLEAEIEEGRRVAEVYAQAGELLSAKAHQLEGEAAELEAAGDREAAEARLKEAAASRALADQNYRKGDEKNRSVKEQEQAAFGEKSRALGITARIKQRASRWDDWEL